jgi:hypothetical protein
MRSRTLVKNTVEQLLGGAQRAEGMREARMGRTGVHQVGRSELANAPATLKRRRVDYLAL